MVSVRCMRGWLPGGKSMTANRVPFAGGAVPMIRAPKSSICSPAAMSAGLWSVRQVSVGTVPGLGYLALAAGPCMSTLATLLASWPVTKRRMGGYCSDMIVIRVLSAISQYSIEFYPDRLDQSAPVRQIVLDELGKLRGREIDALEAVHAEELARLRQFQNLGDVGVNVRQIFPCSSMLLRLRSNIPTSPASRAVTAGAAPR